MTAAAKDDEPAAGRARFERAAAQLNHVFRRRVHAVRRRRRDAATSAALQAMDVEVRAALEAVAAPRARLEREAVASPAYDRAETDKTETADEPAETDATEETGKPRHFPAGDREALQQFHDLIVELMRSDAADRAVTQAHIRALNETFKRVEETLRDWDVKTAEQVRSAVQSIVDREMGGTRHERPPLWHAIKAHFRVRTLAVVLVLVLAPYIAFKVEQHFIGTPFDRLFDGVVRCAEFDPHAMFDCLSADDAFDADSSQRDYGRHTLPPNPKPTGSAVQAFSPFTPHPGRSTIRRR